MTASLEEFQNGITAFYLMAPDIYEDVQNISLPKTASVEIDQKTYSFQVNPVIVDISKWDVSSAGLQQKGAVPNLLVSETYLEQTALGSIPVKIKIKTDKKEDEEILAGIRELFQDTNNVMINARFEKNLEILGHS